MTNNRNNTKLCLIDNKEHVELIKKLSCKIPFPIKELADKLELTIEEERLRFTRSGGIKNKVITVNSIHSEYRKNFTIAHEIAHFLLGHGDQEEEYVNRDSEAGYTKEQLAQEQTADDLAGEILLQEESFREDVREYLESRNLDKLDTQHSATIAAKFAKKYSVSKQSIIMRLKSLGYIDKWVWVHV